MTYVLLFRSARCIAKTSNITYRPLITHSTCRSHRSHQRSCSWWLSAVAAGIVSNLSTVHRPPRTVRVLKLVNGGDAYICCVLFSRPRSEGWPHHGRTFSIYLCPLSFWVTLLRAVLSTSWCCPSRPCVVFLACVHCSLHFLFRQLYRFLMVRP